MVNRQCACPLCGRRTSVGRISERGYWFCHQCSIQFNTQGEIYRPNRDGDLIPVAVAGSAS